jgi:hypothetical protein
MLESKRHLEGGWPADGRTVFDVMEVWDGEIGMQAAGCNPGTVRVFTMDSAVLGLWPSSEAAVGPVRVFRPKFTLEEAIGAHVCSLQASRRVANGIPL